MPGKMVEDEMQYEYQKEVLQAEYMTKVNDLKYESRLEFGVASKPSESALWDKTRKILTEGLPKSAFNPVNIPSSQPIAGENPWDSGCFWRNGEYLCP